MGLLSRLAAARMPCSSDEFWLPEEEEVLGYFLQAWGVFSEKLTFEHMIRTSSFVLWVSNKCMLGEVGSLVRRFSFIGTRTSSFVSFFILHFLSASHIFAF